MDKWYIQFVVLPLIADLDTIHPTCTAHMTNAELGTSQAVGCLEAKSQRRYSKHTVTHMSQSSRNGDETQREGCIHPSTSKSMQPIGVVLPVEFIDLSAGK